MYVRYPFYPQNMESTSRSNSGMVYVTPPNIPQPNYYPIYRPPNPIMYPTRPRESAINSQNLPKASIPITVQENFNNPISTTMYPKSYYPTFRPMIPHNSIPPIPKNSFHFEYIHQQNIP